MARFILQLLAIEFILIASAFGLFNTGSKIQGTKYQLQQKVLTLGTSYTVKDDKGKPVYKVRRFRFHDRKIFIGCVQVGFKSLGVGKHLQLTDVSGNQEFYSSKNEKSLIWDG